MAPKKDVNKSDRPAPRPQVSHNLHELQGGSGGGVRTRNLPVFVDGIEAVDDEAGYRHAQSARPTI